MTSLRGKERQEFSQKVRKAAFARCCKQAPDGVKNIPGVPQCEGCGNELRSGGIFYEHMDPDGLGGDPTAENCQVRCTNCKKAKDKVDNAIMAKADAVLKKTYGLEPSRQKMRGQGFQKKQPQRTATRPIRKWMPA